MIRSRLVRTLLSALVLGMFAVALADHAPWSDASFDPFEEDDGYVELVRSGDALVFVLQAEEGSLPAEVTGDTLPLDDDVFEASSGLMASEDAIALYGGMSVETGVGWVVVQLEGNADAIHDAILARAAQLRFSVEEDGAVIGGPVRSYMLRDGDATFRIAISDNGEGALVHLQDMN